ncbi:MAG: GNAT family protein [Ktedonobacteraceae bacterium]
MEKTKSHFQSEEQPLINIVGEKVALGPGHQGMIPFYSKWDNDFAVAFMSGDPLIPVARENTEARYERESKDDPRNYTLFIIYEYATLRPIGLTELRHIRARNGTADFGILIGEKDCWGKGYGTEATRLMLDYGFTIVNLHNIMLSTFAYNERAIRAYTRAGFRIVGRRREAHRWGDKFYDEVIMDCLSTEFETPLKRILSLP